MKKDAPDEDCQRKTAMHEAINAHVTIGLSLVGFSSPNGSMSPFTHIWCEIKLVRKRGKWGDALNKTGINLNRSGDFYYPWFKRARLTFSC